ncbi:hypothetical protein EXU48_24345 [Occultella glacieicola]|uniref:Uncharacterized protein n=1 Tax=Occultella glacieicola TaxID=2518684 RepID=A0ABY2DZK3_9MICO|nr:hypothetical protein [Occultella glacieicola]TDE88011.1 hypothetical protein EXU48_24345 [Occultella glacieicola]
MRHLEVRRRLGALLLALLATGAVAGCDAISGAAGDAVERAIEEAVDGLDLSDGLPEGFPADVVVVEGQTRGAARTDADGTTTWVALVSATDSGAAARTALEEAGFTVDNVITHDGGLIGQLSSDAYDVKLIASDTQVVYVVTPAA